VDDLHLARRQLVDRADIEQRHASGSSRLVAARRTALGEAPT
jgi:hypothetical protein